MKPRVLIGYSACPLTRAAFEAAGCEAWTCDLLPARDGSDRHFECDVWEVAKDRWDAALFHPMCTYLTTTAAWAFADPDFDRYPEGGYHQKVSPETLVGAARRDARAREIENFRKLLDLPYPKAIENPGRSFISSAIRPADQIVHPYHFGDSASKATGLWITGLPKLKPTAFAEPRRVKRGDAKGRSNRLQTTQSFDHVDLFGEGVMRWDNQTDVGHDFHSPGEGRWLERSKTWPGMASAMGTQWGAYLARKA